VEPLEDDPARVAARLGVARDDVTHGRGRPAPR
jgi:hypothetical protein